MNGNPPTFEGICSNAAVQQYQQTYGTYSCNKKQMLRGEFWSSVVYPSAGASQLTFFGTANNGTFNRALTNIPQPNRFGNVDFLLKSIYMHLYIDNAAISSFTGLNASTLYSDLIAGLAQTGYFTLSISGKKLVEVNKPLLKFGCGGSPIRWASAGLQPYFTPQARLSSKHVARAGVQPNIFIPEDSTFECQIQWPSGAIPILATSVVNDSTNPLYIKVVFDGIVFRPVA